jgi:hypothetical protein
LPGIRNWRNFIAPCEQADRLFWGISLRPNIPQVSQKNFPQERHLLYDSDAELSTLLGAAGFTDIRFVVRGETNLPKGRLALATA